MRSGAGAALASLGSGSRGNGTVVSLDGVHLLVDCGFTLKQTRAAARATGSRAGRSCGHPRDARTQRTTSRASRRWRGVTDCRSICRTARGAGCGVGTISTCAYSTAHDQFPNRIGARDTGAGAARRARADAIRVRGRRRSRRRIDGPWSRDAARHARSIGDCDALLVEANHDRRNVVGGAYPPQLKQRIASPLGHLSNEQTVALLREIGCASAARGDRRTHQRAEQLCAAARSTRLPTCARGCRGCASRRRAKDSAGSICKAPFPGTYGRSSWRPIKPPSVLHEPTRLRLAPQRGELVREPGHPHDFAVSACVVAFSSRPI